MKEKLDLVRLPIILIVAFFAGRLVMGAMGASYDAGNRVFSMVILQTHLALVWGALARRYHGYSIGGAMQVGVLIGLVTQTLIFGATVVSQAAGIETYFNNPIAVAGTPDPITMGTAVLGRALGLVVNCITSGILAAIGYSMGGLIPKTNA